MKGPWEVISNPVGGTMLYGVARLRNTKEVKHSGNLEFYPCGYRKGQGTSGSQQAGSGFDHRKSHQKMGNGSS